MRKLNMFEKGWLASAIDGEGSIRIVGKYNTVTVSVHNTNREFIDFAHELMDTKTKIRVDDRHNGNRKTLYEVQIHSKEDVLNVLPQILPHLIIKKEQAKEAIRVSKLKRDTRKKCKICNNRHHSKGYCKEHWYEYYGKEYHKKWYKKNKERHREISRQYYLKNREKILEKQRKKHEI